MLDSWQAGRQGKEAVGRWLFSFKIFKVTDFLLLQDRDFMGFSHQEELFIGTFKPPMEEALVVGPNQLPFLSLRGEELPSHPQRFVKVLSLPDKVGFPGLDSP